MKVIYNKIIFPIAVLATLITLTGCTIPGSKLTTENKNIVKLAPKPVRQADGSLVLQEFPVSQINVYQLQHFFVAEYAENSNSHASAQVNPLLDEKLSAYEYKVGPGDILNITIWDHPELTIPAGSFRSAADSGHWVHSDGKIFYPYIGFVYVQDKTVVQIRHDISNRLVKYIESPQVDVSLAAFRSQKMYVTGEVKQPGQQPITNVPLTLLDAINQSGGLTAVADWRNVSLTRAGNAAHISLYKLMQKGDLTENRLMQAGDIIHVPRDDSQKVFVLGEVVNAGVIKIDRSGMTLTEALSTVGGINELSADATGVFVIRSTRRDRKNADFLNEIQARSKSSAEYSKIKTNVVANIYQLDIKDASALMIGTEFELEPYDVVYVTAAPIERYNRVLRQLIPTIGGFNALTNAILNVRRY